MDNTDNDRSANLLQSLRVLYVEDDPDTLRELSRYLKKRVGFLASAANGSEALEACSKYPVDVIITDLRMPEMDGLSFVRALREKGSHCPVIITSAFSDSDTIIQAVDLGIVKYCIKPLNTSELILTLEKLTYDRLKAESPAVLSDGKSIDRQRKLEFEKQIRSDFAHLLKTLTGKGPKDIQVVLGSSSVTICICEPLTLLELTLLNNPSNAGLVAYLRKILYTEAREAIEQIIAKTIGSKAALSDVEIDTTKLLDRITVVY